MTTFVILHYRAIDTTRNCIESILKLKGERNIVVVDNASPNNTGEQLYKEYAQNKDVVVILNDKNTGFAKGNNLGVAYTCEHFKSDFVVVLNNDVEIPQEDFLPQLENIYKAHPFDLLGPDIKSIFSGIHQNPKSLHHCTLEAVDKKLAYLKRSQNPVLMVLSSAEKVNPAFWRYLQKRRRARQHIDSSLARQGVMLHGSCVIFSRRYLDKHPEPFYPETFMYYEMEILDYLCCKEKSVVRYDPSIYVLHYQYVSSKMEYKSILKRSKFVIKCLLDSVAAARELILSSEGASDGKN